MSSGDVKFIQSELAHILTQKHSSDTSQVARRAEGNFLKGAMFKRPQKHTPSVCAFIHSRTQTALKLSHQSHCANTSKQISKRAFLTLSNSSILPAIKAMMSQRQMNAPPPPHIISLPIACFLYTRMNKSFMASEDIAVPTAGRDWCQLTLCNRNTHTHTHTQTHTHTHTHTQTHTYSRLSPLQM